MAERFGSRPALVFRDERYSFADLKREADMASTRLAGLGLKPGDAVEVSKSDCSVGFIHFPDYSYYSVLRQKLNWRGSNV